MSDPHSTDTLPDIDVRQDEILQKLDELNLRIERVLKELTVGKDRKKRRFPGLICGPGHKVGREQGNEPLP